MSALPMVRVDVHGIDDDGYVHVLVKHANDTWNLKNGDHLHITDCEHEMVATAKVVMRYTNNRGIPLALVLIDRTSWRDATPLPPPPATPGKSTGVAAIELAATMYRLGWIVDVDLMADGTVELVGRQSTTEFRFHAVVTDWRTIPEWNPEPPPAPLGRHR